MNLSDYVLSYEENGKVVANLFDYYDMFVKPLSDRFKDQSYDNRLVLCFFKEHADVNPSMGYLTDKKHKGNHVYHCLGCKRIGDVVRLNQYIEHAYHNNELDERESAEDLARKFNIDISEFDELADDDYEGRYTANLKRVVKLKNRYSYADFREGLLQQRMQGVDLNEVNFECVKMIATKKQLYN